MLFVLKCSFKMFIFMGYNPFYLNVILTINLKISTGVIMISFHGPVGAKIKLFCWTKLNFLTVSTHLDFYINYIHLILGTGA